MRLYRFSPIETETQFEQTLEYLAIELDKLAKLVLQAAHDFPILKLFAHYPAEYDYLRELLLDFGPVDTQLSSDKNTYVKVDRHITEQRIKRIGLRTVDPYRFQVGCGDVAVDDVAAARTAFAHNPYVREATGSRPMLEFWYPDSDVLGYIIQDSEVAW